MVSKTDQGPHKSASVKDVAQRLRVIRQALDLNQAAMAALVGTSQQAWNNFESGRRRISIDQAILVCNATGVDLDWIYCGETGGIRSDLASRIQQGRNDHDWS